MISFLIASHIILCITYYSENFRTCISIYCLRIIIDLSHPIKHAGKFYGSWVCPKLIAVHHTYMASKLNIFQLGSIINFISKDEDCELLQCMGPPPRYVMNHA